MTAHCAECGAAIADQASCRDHFDALLALEWQIPGGPGALPHFFAVASYALQHPDGMRFTAEAVEGLRRAVADALAGRATVDELRRRARAGARAAGRVTRREHDPQVRWEVARWPVTVCDVVSVSLERERYAERVSHWARSVLRTLDARHPVPHPEQAGRPGDTTSTRRGARGRR
jgi:hypothetical protein